ncbi:MAG TPA: LysR family transcriptional regulator [Brachybacterium faecium]|nr:LysR family transcriptional regulator [Brachybacterium faecium]
MLDPVKLRVLRSVVETESVRASAEALGYTPSAASQHLSALGRETGVALVERSGRGIAVTAAGRRLAASACTALEALDDVERLARELASGRTGSLGFGYVTSVASTWVPVIAHDVRRAFPDLTLELMHRDCTVEEAGNRHDVVLADADSPAFGADWCVISLVEEVYSVLVSSHHPLAGRSELALHDVAELAWATDDPLDSWWFARILSACRASGFTPQVVANPSDYAAVGGFVATGDYISVQPSLIAVTSQPGIVAIPLRRPCPERRVEVRVRRSIAENPAARFIVRRLQEFAVETAERTPGVLAL